MKTSEIKTWRPEMEEPMRLPDELREDRQSGALVRGMVFLFAAVLSAGCAWVCPVMGWRLVCLVAAVAAARSVVREVGIFIRNSRP